MLILVSVGKPAMVHANIDPSYILASLLPRISDDANQPIEAQCPVLQKVIWGPVVGTFTALYNLAMVDLERNIPPPFFVNQLCGMLKAPGMVSLALALG